MLTFSLFVNVVLLCLLGYTRYRLRKTVRIRDRMVDNVDKLLKEVIESRRTIGSLLDAAKRQPPPAEPVPPECRMVKESFKE